MNRHTRVEALQRAYADFPNVTKMLDKLVQSNFIELQELIDRQLALLEQASIHADDWGPEKRSELEASSQHLYDGLAGLEQRYAKVLNDTPAERPN